MLWFHDTLLRLRQRAYPREFRIDISRADDADGALISLLRQGADLAGGARADEEAPTAPPEQGGADHDGDPTAAERELAIAISNGWFRMRRNTERLVAQEAGEGRSSKEVRSLQRALNHMDNVLREHGIECRDLTGQTYDPGREDFQSIGEPEVRPELTSKIILRCERPAVILRQQLIQRAKGVVAKPARDEFD